MKSKILFLAIIPLLSGCAKYQSCHLKRLTPKPVPQHEKILFAAKAFSCSDCQQYLGRDVLSAGYKPIQLSIKNNSDSYLEFELDKINLKTIPANIVAESVYFSVLARALGYGAPAGIVLGAALIPGAALVVWPLIIPALILSPFLIVPAIVDPIWATEANKNLLRDYLEKAVDEKTIAPDTGIEGLIFVPDNIYDNKLEVVLVDRGSLEKIVCKSYL